MQKVATETTPATKRGLLVLSHAMERAFDALDGSGTTAPPGLVIGLFQRREYFDVEADRYAALAAAGHTVVVGFAGPSDGIPPGIAVVPLHDDDALASTWVLILVRGAYATSLVATDTHRLSFHEPTLEASRMFDARWTFQRQTALAEAERHLGLLGDRLPPAALEAAHDHLRRSAAEPVLPAEAQIAAAADHLVAAIDDGHRRVTQVRADLARTLAKAEEDSLTGLHNRHYLERFLGSADGPAQLLVLLVDVDDLKAVNDGRGHDAGDAVLLAVAQTLRDHTVEGDVIVRWGGDEFLVLIPEAGEADGLQMAEGLADAVRRARPAPPFADLSLSVSIGACWTPRTTLPLPQLDAALYRVKSDGKGHAAMASLAATL